MWPPPCANVRPAKSQHHCPSLWPQPPSSHALALCLRPRFPVLRGSLGLLVVSLFAKQLLDSVLPLKICFVCVTNLWVTLNMEPPCVSQPLRYLTRTQGPKVHSHICSGFALCAPHAHRQSWCVWISLNRPIGHLFLGLGWGLVAPACICRTQDCACANSYV